MAERPELARRSQAVDRLIDSSLNAHSPVLRYAGVISLDGVEGVGNWQASFRNGLVATEISGPYEEGFSVHIKDGSRRRNMLAGLAIRAVKGEKFEGQRSRFFLACLTYRGRRSMEEFGWNIGASFEIEALPNQFHLYVPTDDFYLYGTRSQVIPLALRTAINQTPAWNLQDWAELVGNRNNRVSSKYEDLILDLVQQRKTQILTPAEG